MKPTHCSKIRQTDANRVRKRDLGDVTPHDPQRGSPSPEYSALSVLPTAPVSVPPSVPAPQRSEECEQPTSQVRLGPTMAPSSTSSPTFIYTDFPKESCKRIRGYIFSL